MWLLFAISCLVCIIILFFPGYFLFRAFNLERCQSIVYAPLVSLALVCILGLVNSKVSIPSNAFTIAIALSLFCIVCYSVTLLLKKKYSVSRNKTSHSPKFYLILTAYIALGCITTLYMYILPLNGADSFVQMYDNVFHYNIVESFLQSSQWSFLQVDAYLPQENTTIDPLPGSSFYPAGWHILTALIASTLDAPVSLAANSVNAVLMGIIFPVGVFSLLHSIFGNNKYLLLAGAICATIISVFPWSLYNQWALFPNAASLCTTPVVASCFIKGITKLVHYDKNIISDSLAFVVGLASLLFLQPNSIFTLIIFLAPFCIWKMYFYFKNTNGKQPSRLRIILPGIFLALTILLFIIFFKLPFLQSIINYYWPPIMTTTQAILSVLNFSLTTAQPQLLTTFLIFIGIIYLLFRNRENSWLIVSYIFAALIFVIAASDEDTFIKHFLCGYWYTDPYRIAAFLGIFSVPIVASGLSFIIQLAQTKTINLFNSSTHVSIIKKMVTVLLLMIFYFASLVPQSPFANAMTYLKNNAVALNLSEWNYLDSEELEFINKIKTIIPDNELIINQPYDGSMYAYGITGLDLYYRDISGYGSKSETESSVLIRNELNQIYYNEDVQQAVASIDAKYVLLLKPDFESQGLIFSTYDPNGWIGIESINETTPGFHLVYEENQMKLFKIDIA